MRCDKRSKPGGVALVLAFAASACGSSDKVVDRNVEKRLTITQGLYGQATAYTAGASEEPLVYIPGEELIVFPGNQPVTADSVVLASTKSDDHGFFQIQLDAGTYFLCTSFRRCVNPSVRAGECVRYDFDYGDAEAWSYVRTLVPCP